jgi:hypothetical protein
VLMFPLPQLPTPLCLRKLFPFLLLYLLPFPRLLPHLLPHLLRRSPLSPLWPKGLPSRWQARWHISRPPAWRPAT